MPEKFDIGVKFIFEPERATSWNTRVKMRLDDVYYESLIRLPNFRQCLSIRDSDHIMMAAWERLHHDALTAAQTWIDKHPESTPSARETLRRLDDLKEDDVLLTKWMDDCRERARRMRYEVRT